jgi:hypothetical protein
MPVPTHREDCKSLIYSTNCPDCGALVYYFSCSCGSKVYFNLKEPPWNPHEDSCIPYLLRYLTEIERIPESQIRSFVEEYSRTSGVPIPLDVRRRLDELEGHASNRLTINEVHPLGDSRPAMGMIMSINSQVNFFKRFSYGDNVMGRGLLGKLVRDSYVEIVIREDASELNVCNEFYAFQKLVDFRRTGLGQHARVIATLDSHRIPDGRIIWVVEHIERVD